MKNLLLSLATILFLNLVCSAQVGIGNTDPKAAFDITASNQVTPTNTDGILIPRVDAFPLTNPTVDQYGMQIFLTTADGTKQPGLYYWDAVNTQWATIASSESTHYVGELYGGGIVYYVYDNGQHGLIASLDDLDGGSGVQWYNGSNVATGALDSYEGSANTSAITAMQGAGTYAAKLCEDYTNDGFIDWYLPSDVELGKLCYSLKLIYDILNNDGNVTTNPIYVDYNGNDNDIGYWSSTETITNSTMANYFSFSGGYSGGNWKYRTFRVRAIRSF